MIWPFIPVHNPEAPMLRAPASSGGHLRSLGAIEGGYEDIRRSKATLPLRNSMSAHLCANSSILGTDFAYILFMSAQKLSIPYPAIVKDFVRMSKNQ
jgi:hypothetical protein